MNHSTQSIQKNEFTDKMSGSFDTSAESLQTKVVDESVRAKRLDSLLNQAVFDVGGHVSDYNFESISVQVAQLEAVSVRKSTLMAKC